MKVLKIYLKIFIALLILAVSINMFLGPHHIAAGGVSGLGIIAEYTLGWNKAYVIFGLNLIMLALAYCFLGKAVFSKMLFGSFVFPIAIAIVPEMMLTSDRLLSVLFGSGIFAIGISILYRNNASSGGTTIPPLILQKYFHLNPSIGLLLTDTIVVTISLFSFGIEAFLFAILSLIITSIVMNYIETGINRKKSIMIMSETALSEIQEAIYNKVSRGATLLDAKGGHTQSAKQVLLVVVSDQEFPIVKSIVQEIDQEAFVIVNQVAEVMGSGFSYHPIE
ncbi:MULTISPECIES: YitT family protein [unclassified Enterococcus]|uniref:YitT family protein n=1 Tax=unclassified Enterococcus TaxID=2608891 RepID=UPI0015572E59|nr:MULTISPECIES: YitT family protein [unclassified Enterococcus]MBS7578239.1 YitT family protein [Enterococcus sp. MMGLQ5-2]MBS7585522.1 YitT family protein [Enterococcus sp. MMGLQ5-1]NPD13381.1 YitT family protein [Enterococcus sp. MMGLQ5-1]NPD38070.1 YitT family protein [Enterococcus sp. MMGLQ5-2]